MRCDVCIQLGLYIFKEQVYHTKDIYPIAIVLNHILNIEMFAQYIFSWISRRALNARKLFWYEWKLLS